MSWFNRGSSAPPPPPPPPPSSSSFEDPYANDSFSAPSPPSSQGYSGGGGNISENLEAALLQEQQRAAVSAAIAKLTELCFVKCVTRPDSKLSSSEAQCIMHTAERYLDTSMFVMGRMTRQAGGGADKE